MKSKTISKRYYAILTTLYFILIPSYSFADANLPPVRFMSWSETLLSPIVLLLLIIGVESLIYRIVLRVKYNSTVLPAVISAFASSIVGMIVFYGVGRVSRLLILMFPHNWKLPGPVGILVIGLIPAFFASGFIRYFIVQRVFKANILKVRKASWIANIAAYFILVFFALYVNIVLSLLLIWLFCVV